MTKKFQEKTSLVKGLLSCHKVVPVLILDDMSSGLRMCEALMKCGLPTAEVTFRTPAAPAIISEASREFPQLLLGAGTVLSVDSLKRARDAGACFAVAPGLNPAVVEAAIEMTFPFVPGVCTPSEIEQAIGLGCTFLKFFPSEPSGGLSMIKTIAGPYRHLGLQYMPTGGIKPNMLKDYLSVADIACVGGTWMGSAQDISEGNWQKIEASIQETVALVKGM